MLHYWLQAKCGVADAGKTKRLPPLWVQSLINKNVNNIAEKCFQACLRVRDELQKEGVDAFYPICIRCYIGKTEKYVYCQTFNQARNHKLRT